MIEKLVTPAQKIEAEYGLVASPGTKRIRQRDIEAALSPEQIAVRRKLVTERQRAFSSLFIDWKYPHYHQMKHREAAESGQELAPLPSMRADGQVTDYVYRVWWGTKWVSVAQIPSGESVEAQVRRYDESHDRFVVGGGDFERKNPEMAICLRVANPDTAMTSSAQEVFRFEHIPMNNGVGGDILYRGDSIGLMSEHWQELDQLLVGLGEQFGQPGTTREVTALGAVAIES